MQVFIDFSWSAFTKKHWNPLKIIEFKEPEFQCLRLFPNMDIWFVWLTWFTYSPLSHRIQISTVSGMMCSARRESSRNCRRKRKSPKLTSWVCSRRQFKRRKVFNSNWQLAFRSSNTINVKSILDGRNLAKCNLDELDELEDSEDEAIILEFRNKRIREMKELASKAKFGSVREITGEEYVNEVSHDIFLT